MNTYTIAIEGVTPLVWNRMKKELADEISKLKKDQLKEWEEKNWKRKAETNGNGVLVIPPEWIKGALVNACKQTRIVPWFATNKNSTYTQYMTSMVINKVASPGKTKTLEYFGAFVGARGAGSNTKTWRVRPRLPEWKTSFQLIDPVGRMREDELEALLIHAGLVVGIGDGRSVNMGRFEVKSVVCTADSKSKSMKRTK